MNELLVGYAPVELLKPNNFQMYKYIFLIERIVSQQILRSLWFKKFRTIAINSAWNNTYLHLKKFQDFAICI